LLDTILYDGGDGIGARAFAANGRYVAFAVSVYVSHQGAVKQDVHVFDLRSRTLRWQARAGSHGLFMQMAVSRSGTAAWVSRFPTGDAVGAARSHISLTLDRDTTVDPGTLFVTGARVRWTVAGEPRGFAFGA
jgi:hypothetical protein